MYTKKEEAVSPVIGVILMVAITVILAAVIAAFVFGMTGSVSKTKTVALVAEQKSGGVLQVTNMGGQDVKKLTAITAKDNGGAATKASTDPTTNLENAYTQPGTYSLYQVTASHRIVITGTFSDGTTAVLLDYTMT